MYVILPWVKYHYKRLQIGVSNSPEILQQKMNNVFQGFEFIPAYIDELLLLRKLYRTYHVLKSEIALNKMKESGLKCNTEKSFFGQTKMKYLSFWVSYDGLNTVNKNIEAIKNITPYTSQN